MARLSRIAPEIPVSNLREAIEYYERKLGFRIAMEMPAGDYAIVERDDVALHRTVRRAIRPSASTSSRTSWRNCTVDLWPVLLENWLRGRGLLTPETSATATALAARR
jgi:catechol 2,3-dioxygenase-like lactoylglutathione lyase family enzyme